ncbi:hypothetical protein ILUMI_06096 [Ignelater luminosus]|uniref:DUF4802 domain-containing protein n=1 Tax=Ignelater luminosus TaxID=2038154 RepID=A0A8K0GCX5_IGNLU|nr:hypothetical protein ILUMI_06096 [Ignelater luminosus]
MSKTDSSTRGDSMEIPTECEVDLGSPHGNFSQLADSLSGVPSSPPPSYEHVLEEGAVTNELPFYALLRKPKKTRLQAQKDDSTPTDPTKGPEIFHKSSKELYKAVAKQFGITCKMSDQCRCLDCQSHYFDCEYDQNEDEKTDGGLGAGTPMFISEVIHGTACSIL